MTEIAINSEATQQLMILIEESTRASEITARYFIEPAPGTLLRTKSRFHHIIFGRRGSGKSSLLNKVHTEHLTQRIPSAFIDLEKFKGAIYPDVLLSILIQTFQEFEKWLDGAAILPSTKTSFWSKISSLKPAKRIAEVTKTSELSHNIANEIKRLEDLLHQEAVLHVEEETFDSKEESKSGSGSVDLQPISIEVGASGKNTNSTKRRHQYESNKHTELQKNVLRYQKIFDQIKMVSGSDVYLIFDDLYHITREDQASIIDYFHKIGKGGKFWLKIGTVRHRTDHYKNGNPPIGVKLGDDIDSIDLDVTLEKYATTKKFLFEILEGFAADKNVDLSDILTDGARDRLVLVSGGVARDFLSLFRKSVVEARDRVIAGKTSRGHRITAEDVNRASGQYYDDKLQELDKDISQDEKDLVMEDIEALRAFCFDIAESNCILVEKDRIKANAITIGELVDLKILHPIRSGLTVSKRQGKRFDAYMLDFSFYTGDRTKRDIDLIDFWKPNVSEEILRKVSLIYEQKT
jgi:hypothetical protein